MKKSILILFLTACINYGQSDYTKWDEKKVSYEIPSSQHHDYTIDNSNFGLTILSIIKNAYYFFISDLDGDNCPFTPTCSTFFIQAVKETSIFKGTLMFADRFTRDLNLFKNISHYKILSTNKLLDPAINYTLYSEKIKL
jgi:putative component of membrane protein insertase Oxa1/YidC/SpoIIIJ protein YidD